jgi:hypothetical protein
LTTFARLTPDVSDPAWGTRRIVNSTNMALTWDVASTDHLHTFKRVHWKVLLEVRNRPGAVSHRDWQPAMWWTPSKIAPYDDTVESFNYEFAEGNARQMWMTTTFVVTKTVHAIGLWCDLTPPNPFNFVVGESRELSLARAIPDYGPGPDRND